MNPDGLSLVTVPVAYPAMLLLCLCVAWILSEHTQPTVHFLCSISMGVRTALCVFRLSRKSKLAGLNEEGDSIMNKHLFFFFSECLQ